MILVIGLGNPGKKYENTRHNIGFGVADEIAANFQFSPAPLQRGGVQSIFNAQISKGEIAGKKVILAKPQTFMNLSGKAVKLLTRNYKLETKNLVVIHDDIDLPLGKIKISVGHGSAGHKGVESIIQELKTKDFVRFRIGIKPNSKFKIFTPTPNFGVGARNSKLHFKIKNVEDFVLKNFTKDEKKIINDVIEKTCDAIEFYLEEGLEKAMTKYNA